MSGGRVVTISPRVLVEELLRNMRESAVELYSYRVVPSAYRVFLNRTDFAALEPIKSRIVADAQTALDEDLKRLNGATFFQRITFQRPTRYERADTRWQIDLLVDPDQETDVGVCAIRSELVVSGAVPDKAGMPTKFTTTYSDKPLVISDITEEPGSLKAATLPRAVNMNCVSLGRLIAKLHYTDSNGPHVYQIRQSEVLLVIGEAPTTGDVRLVISGCTEMALVIRMDSRTGMIALRNYSIPALTVEGRTVAPNVEVILPAKASICIGSHTTIEFTTMS